MKYDILNIDGDILGEYNGVLRIHGDPEPECWRYIKSWPYFVNIPKQIVGTFEFRTLTVENKRGFQEGLDIRYTVDVGMSYSVATVVPKDDQQGLSDQCPRCLVAGKFVRTALICPKCSGFLGGC